MANFVVLLAMLISVSFSTPSYEVKSIPNPRMKNQWCSDVAHIFNPPEKAELESILANIHKTTGAEVALVTLPSIGNRIPKDYAVELFHYWKVGQKDKNNGLLILLVVDQRRIEMETGYGLEGPLPDVTLSRIQRYDIIPSLKAGHVVEGFAKGLRKIEQLLQTESSSLLRVPQPLSPLPSTDKQFESSLKNVAIVLVGLTSALIFFSLIQLLVVLSFKDPLWRYRKLNKNFGFLFFWQAASLIMPFSWFFWSTNFHWSSVFIGLAMAVLWFLLGRAIRDNIGQTFRSQSRVCPYCKTQMILQNDISEKRFEKPQEIIEEKIGSIDYDIWVCPQDHVRKDSYAGKNFYRYSTCASCHALARKLIRDEVIEKATFTNPENGIRHFQCIACSQVSSEKYVLSPEFSSFSDSDVVSSETGSSFGGGSSGGGGAGSSY